MGRFKKFLFKTKRSKEAQSQHNQMQWLLVFRTVLYTLLLSVNFFFDDTKFELIVLPSSYLLVFISIIYVITICSAFFLNTLKDNFRKFGLIQCLIDTIFAAILVFYTGCSQSIFRSLFFFPIITGGLLFPYKGGFVAAAASTIQFGLILYLEYHDIYPCILIPYEFLMMQNSSAVINHFAVNGLTFFLAALLSTLFASRLAKTEKALHETRHNYHQLTNLYKLVFDNIPTGIITLDDHNLITSVNPAAEGITGYTSGELNGWLFERKFPAIKLAKNEERLASDLIKKDGTATRIGYSYAEFIPVTGHKKPGNPHKILTIQDISKVEMLEKKIRQSEKLAAIGMMSASIAHDFRNPLTAIYGSAQILSSDYEKRGGTNYNLTEIIILETRRMTETIDNFLLFAKPEQANKEWFSLHNCINEVLQVFTASKVWSKTCKIIKNFDDNLDIWADNNQLFKMINELLTNAAAFCPPGRELIEIAAKEIVLEQESWVEISVSDNGPGFSVKDKNIILEPFYTTRPNGTGLGLAIIQRAVEEHQGTISLEKSTCGGAKFTIRLPLP